MTTATFNISLQEKMAAVIWKAKATKEIDETYYSILHKLLSIGKVEEVKKRVAHLNCANMNFGDTLA